MSVITVTTQPTVDPQTPTLTHYQELAAELMSVFDQLAVIIPKLEEAEASATLSVARSRQNVPDAFCATAINAVEQVPEVGGAKKLNTELSRNRLQFLEAFRPVDDKLAAFSRRMRHALRTTKSLLAADTLHAYRIFKSHASDNKSPLVQAHADAMKRDLGRRGSTKAEREARDAERLQKAVEAELLARGLTAQKEVKAA
jgi:hypothetical protein